MIMSERDARGPEEHEQDAPMQWRLPAVDCFSLRRLRAPDAANSSNDTSTRSRSRGSIGFCSNGTFA